MKVLKFGGTSVGSIDSILSVKKIVESNKEPVIVVVSALSGVTDQLYLLAKLASEGNEQYLTEYNRMHDRHLEIINAVVIPLRLNQVIDQVEKLFADLANILKGISLIKDSSAKIIDTIVSYGESISSIIIANTIECAKHFDSKQFIKTNDQFNKHIVDFETTNKQIKVFFEKITNVAVCGGFIATDSKTNNITNLGRGGSDYTAAILAASLRANLLEIWTDVDGFLTADPRVINNTYVIDRLSYTEATELCNFGAKVIYPPTIFPVFHKNIPVVIKNTFNPSAKGTFISNQKTEKDEKLIKGISSINDSSLITIQGLGMVGVIGVNYRIFKALSKKGISVFLVSQASSENSTSIGVRESDSKMAVEELKAEFQSELEMGEIDVISAEDSLATIAIVGDNMRHKPGIAGKLFGTLGKNGINVKSCAQGASETNISFVTDRKSLNKALNVIHDSFFLSEYQILNLFLVGIGAVGGNLLDQIKKQRAKLIDDNGLKLNIVGIASSKKMIFDSEGIDLDNYRTLLTEKGKDTTSQAIFDEIVKMNIFNSVFVDCTANEEIAKLYQSLLDNNISVVTANKIAASSSYQRYSKLKESSRENGVKFLFETNVGAGLPIINTINNLINSGDKILKIEAVLSGTLNFIFNTLSEKTPLSKAIRMAKEAGYSEPDPRIDLSGKDVVRKLVILAREAGYKIEQEDVVKNSFIPEKYFEGEIETFWKQISEIDEKFEEERKRLDKDQKCWRFVAKLESGRCSTGLLEVDATHPFSDLHGTNNIIQLTTERYNEFPMIIKGYGAGSEVTAAGVFSDIISIANVR